MGDFLKVFPSKPNLEPTEPLVFPQKPNLKPTEPLKTEPNLKPNQVRPNTNVEILRGSLDNEVFHLFHLFSNSTT